MGTKKLFVAMLQVLAFEFRGTSASQVSAPGPDGKYTIEAPGIKASFIPYSAAITNLFVANRNGTVRDVVLGYDTATEYAEDQLHPNYGAIPGRYTNRIANHTYELDGKRYYTEVSNPPNSTMHSGTNGWSYRMWDVTDVCHNSITFSLRGEPFSPKGLPGSVLGKVTYTLEPHTWIISIEAQAKTHRTPLMLTNHAYWQLDAFANPSNDTVLNHTLSMPFSKRRLAYDSVSQVNGTILDIPRYSINDFWSSPKQIGTNATAAGWIGNCGSNPPMLRLRSNHRPPTPQPQEPSPLLQTRRQPTKRLVRHPMGHVQQPSRLRVHVLRLLSEGPTTCKEDAGRAWIGKQWFRASEWVHRGRAAGLDEWD